MKCGIIAHIISSCEGPGSLGHCSKLVADKNDGCNTMSGPVERFARFTGLTFHLKISDDKT